MKKFIPIIVMFLLVGGLQSCTDESIPEPENPRAQIYYEFWSNKNEVSVDLEIINNGNTFIESVEVAVEFFDFNNDYIGTSYDIIHVHLHPGNSIIVKHNYWEYDVYDVFAKIIDVWQ